ncbi:MAG: endopeptidase La [Lachnospiraceae bacterium]|nr:endopeptidase La [Lachnospiraceae bacterium]
MVVIPIYNLLLVPDANVYLKSDQYRHLARRYAQVNDRVVLLSCKKEEHRKDMTEESFFPIGVTGYVNEVNPEGYVEIRTTGRVHLDTIGINPDHTIELTISRCEEIEDLDENVEKEHFERLKADLKESWQGFEWGEQAMGYLNQFHSINEVAVAMSIWFKMSAEEKYDILAQDSHKKRLELLEKAVYEFMEVSKVTTKAASAQQEDYQKIYRENAIKKQMELLQRELDEMHPEKVSDIRKFELKIEEAGMNETAKGEALKVLNRLKQENNGGTEAGMLYDYLDFVTGLSWKTEPQQDIDLSEAEAVLEEDHFGLGKVKQRIIQQIAVMNLKKEQAGSILLFVGAPGTGKTSIGQSIAKALHREYVRVSLGGVRDEADIRGHRRTYIGAMPGRIMDGIKKSGVSNPVMVLDEVDKLGVSYNGDPASALLEVLDPEQNSTFTDHYMNVPYDLSNVMFICTANSVDTIPEPLLNRMEVIRFNGYTASDKFQIARRHLLPKAMKAMGVTEEQIVISDDIIRKIIDNYTMESGVRGLRKRLDTLCRSAAVEVSKRIGAAAVEAAKMAGAVAAEAASAEAKQDDAAAGSAAGDGTGDSAGGADVAASAEAAEVTSAGDAAGGEPAVKEQTAAEAGTGTAAEPLTETVTAPLAETAVIKMEPIVVKEEDLREMLDAKPVRHDRVLAEKKPGIVTGLAWTAAGGEILFIETLFTKGSGKFTVTGQLGDVMKASVQIAVSLVKSMFPDKASLFEENDLHIHVPEGAVPKDGPSAGITMTTALASLVSDRAVAPTIAMTGEVSLRGVVTPIGGLPEKLMAASRAGIQTVFIPKENEDDLDEVPQEVRDKLTIIPVSDVTEVLERTGILDGSEEKID